MITEYFAENLRQLMETHKIDSIVSLSKESNIPRGRINNWQTRLTIPKAEDIETLSKFFKVEAYYFFMTPGTQGTIKPVSRSDEFSTLLDEIAKNCLTDVEYETFKKEGASEFVRVLRANFETSHILPVTWCLKINSELKKYVSIDLEEKLRAHLREAQASKKA